MSKNRLDGWTKVIKSQKLSTHKPEDWKARAEKAEAERDKALAEVQRLQANCAALREGLRKLLPPPAPPNFDQMARDLLWGHSHPDPVEQAKLLAEIAGKLRDCYNLGMTRFA